MKVSLESQILIVIVAAILCSSMGGAQDLQSRSDRALQFAAVQLKKSVVEFHDSVTYVRSTLPDGSWKKVSMFDWTSGFFPGCLWYMYEYTHDQFFKSSAERWTEGLEPVKDFRGNHDIGFMIFNSYGNGFRLSSSEKYKKIILHAAHTQISRFNLKVGCIKSWDNPKWQYPVIIDNMMNLEMLFWASHNGGTKEMYDAAFSHAEKTMQNHFRADGSAYHVVEYDSITGRMIKGDTHQGYSAQSVWSRGQAWAIYGFTMTYRFTKDERFLQTALRAADYFILHLPEDFIPYWDYQAPGIPNEPRDASAAAIAASGLLELSTYAKDENISKRYFRTATSILTSLCSPAYLAEGTSSHGIINHSVTSKPANSEIDVTLIYADYYFIEGMLRYRKLASRK